MKGNRDERDMRETESERARQRQTDRQTEKGETRSEKGMREG